MDAHDSHFAGLELFVTALAHAGVRHACIAPGARSTPLALMITAHRGIRAWSHIDERSGAFFALGIAKALREPVAIVCTSGTAAANLLPAVVEAFYAHVPLVVLTADRPPELRDCGAGQTIDQIKLYGTHVKWFAEVGTPDAGVEYFRVLGSRAAAAARTHPSGPVHLNFPLREPLVPSAPCRGEPACSARLPAGASIDSGHTIVHRAVPVPCDDTVRALAASVRATPRGLIVCGPYDADAAYGPAVVRLARVAGYPVLADPTSQVRSGTHDTSVLIDAYDALLRHGQFAQGMAPDLVLRFGPMPTSKAFLNFMRWHSGCRHIVIDALAAWNDPTRMATEMVPGDPVITCDALCRRIAELEVPSPDGEWRARWRDANACTRKVLQHQFDGMTELFEGKVFTELSQLLPDGAWLYVGNSMPIRDLESFWPAGARRVRFLCNRGANGIDGFLSSGLGAAAVSDQPVVIVTGDLGFYHDLNGLLAAKRYGVRATIIVINNDGGGIFSFLPQAECGEAFTEYFLTPHGLDFRGAAEMYGCAFTRIASWEQFRAAVASALCADRTSVIEIPSDRTRNVALHQRLWAAVGEALA